MQKIERATKYHADGSLTEASRVTETNEPVVARAAEPSSIVAARVVWFIAGIIIALLAIRFILILLGASAASSFVSFIYSVSYPFAAPFFGIFGYSVAYGVAKAELSTLVAIAIYALIAWGIARLLTIRRTDTV